MQKKMLPPPGGIISILVPTLLDPLVQNLCKKHQDFVWLDWSDLRLLEQEASLPVGSTVVVHSAVLTDERQKSLSTQLTDAGAGAVWFEQSFREVIEAANTMSAGTRFVEQVSKGFSYSGKELELGTGTSVLLKILKGEGVMENEAIRLEDGKKVVVVVPDSRDYEVYETGPYGSRFVVMNLAKLRALVAAPEQQWPKHVQTAIFSRKIQYPSLREQGESIAKGYEVTDIRLIRSSEDIHQILRGTLKLLQSASNGAGHSQTQRSQPPKELTIKEGGKVAVLGIGSVVAYGLGLNDSTRFLIYDRGGAQHLPVLPPETRALVLLKAVWEMPAILQRFLQQAVARSIAVIGDDTWDIPQLAEWLSQVKITWLGSSQVESVEVSEAVEEVASVPMEAGQSVVLEAASADIAEAAEPESVGATASTPEESRTLSEVLTGVDGGRSNTVLDDGTDVTQLLASHFGIGANIGTVPGQPLLPSGFEMMAKQLEEKTLALEQAQESIRRLRIANLRLLKEKNALAAQVESAKSK